MRISVKPQRVKEDKSRRVIGCWQQLQHARVAQVVFLTALRSGLGTGAASDLAREAADDPIFGDLGNIGTYRWLEDTYGLGPGAGSAVMVSRRGDSWFLEVVKDRSSTAAPERLAF